MSTPSSVFRALSSVACAGLFLLTGCAEKPPAATDDTADADADADADSDTDTDTDTDGDGYSGVEDCDEASPEINVAATEVCDGVDNNCDGKTDDADSELDLSTAPAWYADVDGDGYGDAATATSACVAPAGRIADATDCDDSSDSIHPGALETCNELDDDCDTLVDAADPDLDPAELIASWPDADGDGYGDEDATPALVCTVADGSVTNPEDCDDTQALAWVGAVETCDGVDNDCDGVADSSDLCPCDVEYNGDTTHPYMFCTPGVPWETARSNCEAYGYHLATITSEGENVWVHDSALPYNPYYWWIGLNDLSVEGSWEWVDGSAVTYTKWKSGEPSNSGGAENCVHFIANQGPEWNDLGCSTSQNYVCEAG